MNTTGNTLYNTTEGKIQDAFIELLQAKKIEQISIKEICSRAEVNRSTFYYHFLDIYDLLDKTFAKKNNEMMKELQAKQENQPFSEQSFRDFFEFIKQHRELYFFTNNMRASFPLQEENQMINELFRSRNNYSQSNEFDLEYEVTFFQAGFTFILRKWLQSGCQDSIDSLLYTLKVFKIIQ